MSPKSDSSVTMRDQLMNLWMNKKEEADTCCKKENKTCNDVVEDFKNKKDGISKANGSSNMVETELCDASMASCEGVNGRS